MKLLSEHEDVLAEFNSGQVAVPQDSGDGGWIEVSTEELGVGGGTAGAMAELWKPRPMGGAAKKDLEVWRDPGLRNLAGLARGGSVPKVGWLGEDLGPRA